MAAQRVRTVSTPLLCHHHHIFCSRITTLPARLNELTHVLPLTKDTQMQGSSVAPPFQPVYTLTSSESPLLVHIRRFALWETDRIGRCGRCNPIILAEGDFSGPVCWCLLLSFDTMSSSCKQRTHVPPPVSTYKRLSL